MGLKIIFVALQIILVGLKNGGKNIIKFEFENLLFINTYLINSDTFVAVSLIPQDTPGYPRTLQDSIICMFNILYERVDDGLY